MREFQIRLRNRYCFKYFYERQIFLQHFIDRNDRGWYVSEFSVVASNAMEGFAYIVTL
jgi:hypothetical protein